MIKKLRYAILTAAIAFNIYLVFFFANEVPVLGKTVRILFLHVPSAWIGTSGFAIALIFSIIYLIKEKSFYAEFARFAALTGFVLIIVATISGSIWAKLQWNSFWNWDPRETSIVLLILIYAAYFTIQSSITNSQTRNKVSSVYLIAAAFTVPVLIFIIPRIYFSLHPSPVIGKGEGTALDNTIKITLFYSLFCSSWIYTEFLLRKSIQLKKS